MSGKAPQPAANVSVSAAAADPRVRLLRGLLLANPQVCMPPDVPKPDLDALHGQMAEVRVEAFPGFELGYCWFNAREAVHRQGGTPIAGWAIWRLGTVLVAQPHSIWQRVDGELQDVTPNAAGEPRILFMPDKRTPFDYVGLRRPPGFHLRDDDPLGVWEYAPGRFEPFYGVGRPQPGSLPGIEAYCARLAEGRGADRPAAG